VVSDRQVACSNTDITTSRGFVKIITLWHNGKQIAFTTNRKLQKSTIYWPQVTIQMGLLPRDSWPAPAYTHAFFP
jgi:hypothetical protein